MNGVSYDQWVLYALVFLLGLVIGMALMAGGKWKRRYKEEAKLRQEEIKHRKELETENRRLKGSATEMNTLRHSAARDDARHRSDGPGPL